MQLDFSALMSQKTLTCPCRMQVTANLMQDMAQQLLFFNTKVRILAQKTASRSSEDLSSNLDTR